jgi:hypothetical protein
MDIFGNLKIKRSSIQQQFAIFTIQNGKIAGSY